MDSLDVGGLLLTCVFHHREKTFTKAFFRGSATGGGTTVETNQRLMLAYLCNKWESDENKKDLLDAQLTAWNARDKKIASSPMTFIRKSSFDFTAGKEHFTPIYGTSLLPGIFM
jgi:hypothetical protein